MSMRALMSRLLSLVAFLQALFGLRVMLRLARTFNGQAIRPCDAAESNLPLISVVVPVLNECERLAPCLQGLLEQGPEVAEILVVDGGSTDGTPELVAYYQARDKRLRLIDAGPTPPGWNGKAWNLQVGFDASASSACWLLTLDADVRPSPDLARSLVVHAQRAGIHALSVATQQEVSDALEAFVHAVFLATLVYRFGAPGHAVSQVDAVQANGQCFLVHKDALRACGGFEAIKDSLCEDVTLARALVTAGYRVGFYEAGSLARVRMYRNWRDVWDNWPRSLPLRDRFWRTRSIVALIEVTFVQALPLLFTVLLWPQRRRRRWAFAVNSLLVGIRLGVLWGMARAYASRPWGYWLSPLCDLPAVVRLWDSLLRRRHTWRGREIVVGEW
jgi:dolichol-phosphate mannosyltransferase